MDVKTLESEKKKNLVVAISTEPKEMQDLKTTWSHLEGDKHKFPYQVVHFTGLYTFSFSDLSTI